MTELKLGCALLTRVAFPLGDRPRMDSLTDPPERAVCLEAVFIFWLIPRVTFDVE